MDLYNGLSVRLSAKTGDAAGTLRKEWFPVRPDQEKRHDRHVPFRSASQGLMQVCWLPLWPPGALRRLFWLGHMSGRSEESSRAGTEAPHGSWKAKNGRAHGQRQHNPRESLVEMVYYPKEERTYGRLKRMPSTISGAEQTKSPFPNFFGKGPTIISIVSIRLTGCFLAFCGT